MKKRNFFDIQIYIALIPFVGLFVSTVCVWCKIYKITHCRKYMLLHYLLVIIPLVLMVGLFSVLYFSLIVSLNETLRNILTLVVAYICYAISSLCSVFIGKRIVYRYNEKHIM